MIYLGQCDTCAALTGVPLATAKTLFVAQRDSATPEVTDQSPSLLVGPCTLVRDTGAFPAKCAGNVYLVAAVSISTVADCIQYADDLT